LWLEYPDAITEPLKDQHSSACRDWFAVQRWLAASDGNATVVLSPLDTPLVTLGGLTGATWPRELALKRAHVFAYVMNNYWHTNYKATQGGHHVFRFSLISHSGGFSKRDALTRGWEMFSPPVAQRVASSFGKTASAAARSLVEVKPSGLPLLAFKQAEDLNGFVLRFCDFWGAGGKATLALPKPASAIFACNLVEASPIKQKFRGKTLITPVRHFGLATVKVQFE
jgi:alpha-mannosidase